MLAEWEGNHLLSTYYVSGTILSLEYRVKIGKALFCGVCITEETGRYRFKLKQLEITAINQQARLFQIMINNIYVLRKFSKNYQ